MTNIDSLVDNILKKKSVAYSSNAKSSIESAADSSTRNKRKHSSISSGLCAMAAFSAGVDALFILAFGISGLFCLLVVVELMCCALYYRTDN